MRNSNGGRHPVAVSSRVARALPQCGELHRELRGKGVTLALLWRESKAVHPQGLQYGRFRERYRAWASTLDVVMRHEHRAGEKMCVDDAGQTVPVVGPHAGAVREAQIFVAVLGASNDTFGEATWTRAPTDRIASHVRAFHFHGGCAELVIPDDVAVASRGADCAGRARIQGHSTRACRLTTIFSPIHRGGGCHAGTRFLRARHR